MGDDAEKPPPSERRQWFEIMGDFVVEMLISAAMFILIALVAFALAKFIGILSRNGAPEFMVAPMTALEYLLFIVDVALFALSTLKSGLKLAVKIWRS